MKKIHFKNQILFMFFVITYSCKAQILPLQTKLLDIPNNAHLKDLDNVLIPYVGTYKANFQGNEISLFISKQDDKLEIRSKKQFYIDALIIKYIVKNAAGIVLQDTQNFSTNIELYSLTYSPSKNRVLLYYSGTNCGVGWGDVLLKKINATQISWEYIPDNLILPENCPPNADLTIYLPETENLIFTKQ